MKRIIILVLILIILVIQIIQIIQIVKQSNERYTSPTTTPRPSSVPSMCDQYLTAACQFRNQYPLSSCSTQCNQGTYQFDPLRRQGLSGNLSLCQAVCDTSVNCGNYCNQSISSCACPTRAPGTTPAPVCDPNCPLTDMNYLDLDEQKEYCAWLKANNYKDTQCGDTTSSCRPC